MAGQIADIPARTANRASIIAAATRLFARNGYAASMEHIAAEAKVAKQTVYNHFASKEALLTAIVDALVEQLGGALPEPESGIDDPQATLLDYARRLVAILVQPEALGLHRVLIAGAPHHPELARIAYEAGVVQSTQRLARYLREQAARGALAVPDAELAAEQLLGALRGNIQLRALLLRDGAQDRAALERYAAAVIDAFLRAHRAPRS
jgi:AcrR family transcriptional regulator